MTKLSQLVFSKRRRFITPHIWAFQECFRYGWIQEHKPCQRGTHIPLNSASLPPVPSSFLDR